MSVIAVLSVVFLFEQVINRMTAFDSNAFGLDIDIGHPTGNLLHS